MKLVFENMPPHFQSTAIRAVVLLALTTLPVPSPALAQDGPMLTVSVAQGQISLNENGTTRVIGIVPSRTRLWALETKGEFYRVVDPASRTIGWIWSGHVTPDRNSDEAAKQLWEAYHANEAAIELDKKGDYRASVALNEKAVKIRTKWYGADDPHTRYCRKLCLV